MSSEPTSTSSILSLLIGKKKWASLGLPTPGSYDNLHKQAQGILPTHSAIEGAKFELTSILNQNFQVSHSFAFGGSQVPPMYHFGAGYNTPSLLLHGLVDHSGGLQARANYNWIPQEQPKLPSPGSEEVQQAPVPVDSISSTSKFQAQISGMPGQTMAQLEHEHIGSDFSLSLKAINANPFDAPSSKSAGSSVTGIFSASFLQSISKSWALGSEVVLQRPSPDVSETSYTLGIRYAPRPFPAVQPPPSLPEGMPSPYLPIKPSDPPVILCTSYSPSSGLFQSSFYRRLNQRLEVGAELQMLLIPGSAGRREGLAQLGFKLDTLYATIRGMVDTTGKVASVIEERIAPGLMLQLSGELDYSKGHGGAGKVGIGFTLEA